MDSIHNKLCPKCLAKSSKLVELPTQHGPPIYECVNCGQPFAAETTFEELFRDLMKRVEHLERAIGVNDE